MVLHKAAPNPLFWGPLSPVSAPPPLAVPPYEAASYGGTPAGLLPCWDVFLSIHTVFSSHDLIDSSRSQWLPLLSLQLVRRETQTSAAADKHSTGLR